MRKSILLVALFSTHSAYANISTPQLISSSLAPDCVEFKVKGTCFWLFCTMFGCKVRTSVKVHHYIPNAVISSYSNTGQNPWKEIAFLSTPNGAAQAGGNNEQKLSGQQYKYNLHFKEADVIGHPALSSPMYSQMMGQFSYTCSSSNTSYLPYFLSSLDAILWRTGTVETFYPEANIPGMREIGNTLAGNMWGNIYPRTGFVTQVDDYKAAAVVAQRAADIVTRPGQLHIYNTLSDNPSPGYWPPEPVMENAPRNHKWQRLVPQIARTCQIFPDFQQSIATDGGYAWALWRPYSCCKRRGQTFLYSIDFN